MENVIKTETEEIRLVEYGIVYCNVLSGKIMTLEDGKENVAAIAKLAKHKKVPVIVDIRNSKGATKECRRYFAGRETAKVQKACALIIDSPFSRLIGNFFMGMNKTLFPTRLFNDKNEAINWLKQFCEE